MKVKEVSRQRENIKMHQFNRASNYRLSKSLGLLEALGSYYDFLSLVTSLSFFVMITTPSPPLPASTIPLMLRCKILKAKSKVARKEGAVNSTSIHFCPG